MHFAFERIIMTCMISDSYVGKSASQTLVEQLSPSMLSLEMQQAFFQFRSNHFQEATGIKLKKLLNHLQSVSS